MYWAVLLRWGQKSDEETTVMLDYRRRFPAPGLTQAEAKEEASRRVAWILWWRKWMPPFLGAGGPLVTGIGFWLTVNTGAGPFILLCLGLAIGLFLLFMYMMPKDIGPATKTSREQMPKWARRSGYAALALFAAVVVISFIDPVRLGLWLGPVPIFLTGIAMLVGIGTLLSSWSRQSHLPLFSALMIGLVLAQLVGDESTIRYLVNGAATDDIAGRPSPQEALDIWQKHHVAAAASSGSAASAPAVQAQRVPIAFVATAGGGSRAAYWTATILGTLEDRTGRKFSDHTFAISGVSGGSLGAAIFRSLLPLDQKLIGSKPYVELGQKAAEGDFLGPVLAALFTHDLLPSFSDIWAPAYSEQHPIFIGDRAVALERSWEARWADAVCENNRECAEKNNLMAGSFIKLFGNPGNRNPLKENERPWPALLLNGTAVETGARIVTSNLKIECTTTPGADPCTRIRDVADLLAHLQPPPNRRAPDLDLRLSTAVSNSARFPFIGPAAVTPIAIKLPNEEESRTPNQKTTNEDSRIHARLVDGGYFENFAATTLRELMATLESSLEKPELLPIVIQISSDPELDTKFDPGYGRAMVGDSKISRFLAQLSSPVSATYKTRDAHGAQARLALEDEAERIGARYFHLRLCAAQGVSRPPLAWVLSEEARKHIKASLDDTKNCPNKLELDKLVACLKTPTEAACPPSFPRTGQAAFRVPGTALAGQGGGK
jgi:hypothetical protein